MPIRSVALVEDDKAVADMYRLGLETRGLRVTVYLDAASFFEALETSVPDLVVLDWVLGGTNGGEVLKWLRHHPGTKTLRVVVLSNLSKRDFATVVPWIGPVVWLEKIGTLPLALADQISHMVER
ncbi:MAG TPA: response regulator [Candidatus Acidoferrales bacterium]|nr:response regulator [Candidatus Dormibacteraeota bacterium]HEX2710978.1 response regulator [Candidatus Acidoferrales bacterium]